MDSVLVSVGQQRQEARSLNRDGELTLIERLRARDAARHDLACFSDVAFESRKILVIDGLNAFGREAAKLLPARKAASLRTFVAWSWHGVSVVVCV
jgi:hypothetical protein